MMCLNVVSLIFLGVYQASHIGRFTVLTKFWKHVSICFSNNFSIPLCLLLREWNYMCIRPLDLVPQLTEPLFFLKPFLFHFSFSCHSFKFIYHFFFKVSSAMNPNILYFLSQALYFVSRSSFWVFCFHIFHVSYYPVQSFE